MCMTLSGHAAAVGPLSARAGPSQERLRRLILENAQADLAATWRTDHAGRRRHAVHTRPLAEPGSANDPGTGQKLSFGHTLKPAAGDGARYGNDQEQTSSVGDKTGGKE